METEQENYPELIQDFVDVSEAAKLLNLTPDAIRKQIKRRAIAAHKNGGRWLVARPEPAEDESDRLDESETNPVRKKKNRAMPEVVFLRKQQAESLNIIGRQQETILGLTSLLCQLSAIQGLNQEISALGTRKWWWPFGARKSPETPVDPPNAKPDVIAGTTEGDNQGRG